MKCFLKNYRKDYSWNPATCIYQKSMCSKSIVENWVIMCDEIITATDIVTTNMTNTVTENMTNTVSIDVTSTVSPNSEMYCYILHTFLLMIILLFIIAFTCYHFTKQKTKTYWCTNNIKMENIELKRNSIKSRLCYYFDDTTKIEYFDFDNILLDEKLY